MASPAVPIWDQRNESQHQLVCLNADLRERIQTNCPDLMKIVDIAPLWPYLLQHTVVERWDMEEIQLNATRGTMVDRLLRFIERGPCWKYHSLMRSLHLSNQDHVITLLGLDPSNYMDQDELQMDASYGNASAKKRPSSCIEQLSYIPAKCSRLTQPTPEDLHGQRTSRLHCSFIIKEDCGLEYTEVESPEYNSFAEDIKTAITKAIEVELNVDVVVKLNVFCQKNRTGFITVSSGKELNQSHIANAITESVISTSHMNKTFMYHILPDSIVFREEIKNSVVVDIHRKRHITEQRLDRPIDLDTQYVRLKLLSNTSMGTMQRDALERPDLYQQGLEKHEGRDIQDEDLVRTEDFQKYVLVRGRAGIGKTTLIQRLLWRWANGEWATKFNALFLLNLRYLMTIDRKMDLSHLLSLYAVYNTGKDGIPPTPEWLYHNEGKIGLIMDGIDEIQNFKGLWDTKSTIRDVQDQVDPLEWCFGLMRRECLPRTTLIVSSRPFADLRVIECNLKEKELAQQLMMVELMGLTRERVMEFVDKNATEDRREFVKQTLVKNPILLSVCAITFYCAALCHLLGDDEGIPDKLVTYTQITAYIMQMYMQRSRRERLSLKAFYKEVAPTLVLLSRLAFDGLVDCDVKGLPRLVFDQHDLQKLNIESCMSKVKIEAGTDHKVKSTSRGNLQGCSDATTETNPSEDKANSTRADFLVHSMRRAGLLMQTEMPDPEQKEGNEVLSQFVHLSIQEFLAMAGLLKKDPEQIKEIMRRLSKSEQFNMAQLFLYGLAFNQGNDTIKNISTALIGPTETGEEIKKILTDSVVGVASNLQALQIAHESQMSEMARVVGNLKFPFAVEISRTKLTVVDIIALTFLLKHHPDATNVQLFEGGLDLVSVTELSTFLSSNKSVERLELRDDCIDDEGMKIIMNAMKENTMINVFMMTSQNLTDKSTEDISEVLTTDTTLLRLELFSDRITDNGIKNIADALKDNKTLAFLQLRSDAITDVGVKAIADALTINTKLKNLSLTSDRIAHEGMEAVAHALKSNTSLKKVIFIIKRIRESTVDAFIEAIGVNENVSVQICTELDHDARFRGKISGNKRIRLRKL